MITASGVRALVQKYKCTVLRDYNGLTLQTGTETKEGEREEGKLKETGMRMNREVCVCADMCTPTTPGRVPLEAEFHCKQHTHTHPSPSLTRLLFAPSSPSSKHVKTIIHADINSSLCFFFSCSLFCSLICLCLSLLCVCSTCAPLRHITISMENRGGRGASSPATTRPAPSSSSSSSLSHFPYYAFLLPCCSPLVSLRPPFFFVCFCVWRSHRYKRDNTTHVTFHKPHLCVHMHTGTGPEEPHTRTRTHTEGKRETDIVAGPPKERSAHLRLHSMTPSLCHYVCTHVPRPTIQTH
ncbi:hypothetical protein TRSC58_07371 [Trypanosoma rangeli SC58]|uniref:Uncharacterized protein n=1 Tax=Trypanosoma rangeli SC58 TaxID=429131 RepID=A0A061IVH5_TRYRA|nr:hypothetical protein TRSC58_07371 [Trypanosoma rangeli SC58]